MIISNRMSAELDDVDEKYLQEICLIMTNLTIVYLVCWERFIIF